MSPRARGLIAGVLLLANVGAACTSWRVQSVTPQELLAREHPSSIQVRERGGAVFVLTAPRVTGDSLTGYSKRVPRTIPMAAVDQLALRKRDGGKTAGLIALLVALPAVALLAAAKSIESGLAFRSF